MVSGSLVGGRGNIGDAFVKSWPCGRGTDPAPTVVVLVRNLGQIFGGEGVWKAQSGFWDSNLHPKKLMHDFLGSKFDTSYFMMHSHWQILLHHSNGSLWEGHHQPRLNFRWLIQKQPEVAW